MTDIDRIVTSINKELKTNLVVGDDEALDTLRIPTGMPALDQMLGGGVPRQAVTELFGYQSSGKTYISQRIIAHAQTLGYTCGFIDAEFSYDPEWSSNVGFNTHDLIVSRPDTGERALDVLLALCEQGIDLVVPEEGKFTIFPSWLKHSVSPFYGPGVRRAVSFNVICPESEQHKYTIVEHEKSFIEKRRKIEKVLKIDTAGGPDAKLKGDRDISKVGIKDMSDA